MTKLIFALYNFANAPKNAIQTYSGFQSVPIFMQLITGNENFNPTHKLSWTGTCSNPDLHCQLFPVSIHYMSI
jgi:hypothetical protein